VPVGASGRRRAVTGIRESGSRPTHAEHPVRIPAAAVTLDGDLVVPDGARAIILFAHGSGSSRLSPRNRLVAAVLQDAGFATLLMDLLTREEEAADEATGALRFDIPLLAARLVAATDWIRARSDTTGLRVGYFGASTGAAAALTAAAERPRLVDAVVSRGGRPDLAEPVLARVRAPTLLIVGQRDQTVIAMNEAARRELAAEAQLIIVPRATHLFEEPGALEEVARLACAWFTRHLASGGA